MMTNIQLYVEPLWKVKGFFNRTSWTEFDVHIVRKTWVVSPSLRLSVSPSLVCCMVLVVVVVEGGGEEGGVRRRRD